VTRQIEGAEKVDEQFYLNSRSIPIFPINHEEHDSFNDWAGEFASEDFDLVQINAAMKAGFPY